MEKHWLKTALERIKAGEEEGRVLLEYGYAKIVVVTEEKPKICSCDDDEIDAECPMGHGRDLARQMAGQGEDNNESIPCFRCNRIGKICWPCLPFVLEEGCTIDSTAYVP